MTGIILELTQQNDSDLFALSNEIVYKITENIDSNDKQLSTYC